MQNLPSPQTLPSLGSVGTQAIWGLERGPAERKGDWKPSPEKGHELLGQTSS